MKHIENNNLNFNLNKSICKELECIVQILNNEINFDEKNNIRLIFDAWNSSGSELFAKKYINLIGELKIIRDEVLEEEELINSIFRKMYHFKLKDDINGRDE